MNKLILSIATLLTTSTCVFAQNPIYRCDFDNGIPDTLTLFDYDGNVPKEGLGFPANTAWASWSDPDDEANMMAASCSYYENGKQASDWMILPMLALPEDSASCQLYWRSRSAYDSFKDGYLVLLATTKTGNLEDVSDNNWKTLKRVSNSENPAKWTSWQANLSEYAGDSVFVAFANITQDGWMLFLDDITVGPRESVTKATVRLTSELYAENGNGIVRGKMKAGIMDTIIHFVARATTETDTISYEYKNLNVMPNTFYEFTLKTPLYGTAPEIKPYGLQLMENDTTVMAADSSRFIYTLVLNGEKNIVAEAVINSNDGYSLRAIEGFKKMEEQADFIGLQLHIGDSMTPTDDEAYMAMLQNDYQLNDGRKVLTDRVLTGESYDDIASLYAQRKTKKHLVEATLNGTADDETAEINVASLLAVPGELADYTYKFILTEDSVWNNQWNLYAEGLFGDFNDYETLGYEVEMPFNNVVRKVYAVDSMYYADSIAAGDTLKWAYSLPLPENIREPRRLKMTMIITDSVSGEIINAARCALTYTGTREPDNIDVSITPKNEGTFCLTDGCIVYKGENEATVRVYTLDGVQIGKADGCDLVKVDVSHCRSKLLLVKIQTGKDSFTRKVAIK